MSLTEVRSQESGVSRRSARAGLSGRVLRAASGGGDYRDRVSDRLHRQSSGLLPLKSGTT